MQGSVVTYVAYIVLFGEEWLLEYLYLSIGSLYLSR